MKAPVRKQISRAGTRKPLPRSSRKEALGGATLIRDPAPPKGSKWSWHFQKLLALRDRLFAERGLHRADAAQTLESHSMDQADSGTDEFDHDLSLAALSTDQDSLYEIDQALKRIANGTYGTCESTGKPIPAPRLRAVPWTRFRIEVEDAFEKTKLVHRPHLGNLGSVQSEHPADMAESENEEDRPEKMAGDETLREISLPASLAHQRNTPAPTSGRHNGELKKRPARRSIRSKSKPKKKR